MKSQTIDTVLMNAVKIFFFNNKIDAKGIKRNLFEIFIHSLYFFNVFLLIFFRFGRIKRIINIIHQQIPIVFIRPNFNKLIIQRLKALLKPDQKTNIVTHQRICHLFP